MVDNAEVNDSRLIKPDLSSIDEYTYYDDEYLEYDEDDEEYYYHYWEYEK